MVQGPFHHTNLECDGNDNAIEGLARSPTTSRWHHLNRSVTQDESNASLSSTRSGHRSTPLRLQLDNRVSHTTNHPPLFYSTVHSEMVLAREVRGISHPSLLGARDRHKSHLTCESRYP